MGTRLTFLNAVILSSLPQAIVTRIDRISDIKSLAIFIKDLSAELFNMSFRARPGIQCHFTVLFDLDAGSVIPGLIRDRHDIPSNSDYQSFGT
jgi:hypothetical protein